MPLEIRELVIRVSVNENSAQPQVNDNLKEKLREMKNGIIKECMDKIIARIEKRSEP